MGDIANKATDKGLIPQIYKQLNIKNTIYPNEKTSRRPNQTFLQTIHTDGHKAQEKMLSINNYQRNENQNYNEVPTTTHPSDWPSSKNIQTINGREGG